MRITSPCKEQFGLGWGSVCTWSICHVTVLLRYQQKDLRSPCVLGVFSLHICLNLLNSAQQHWDCICFYKCSSRTQVFLRSCFFFPLLQPLLLNGLMLNLLICAVAWSGVISCSATFIHPLKDVHIGPSWHIKGLPPPATAVISLTPQ